MKIGDVPKKTVSFFWIPMTSYDVYLILEEAYMACNVNPDMILRAKVLSNWDDAPPGFFCAPRKYLPLAPRWVVHGLTCSTFFLYKVIIIYKFN
jgi:hypothetical protein